MRRERIEETQRKRKKQMRKPFGFEKEKNRLNGTKRRKWRAGRNARWEHVERKSDSRKEVLVPLALG